MTRRAGPGWRLSPHFGRVVGGALECREGSDVRGPMASPPLRRVLRRTNKKGGSLEACTA